MTEMFATLGSWNWLIFGVIMMALEVLAPGIFLFWLGLAALLVGLLALTGLITFLRLLAYTTRLPLAF